MVLFFDALADGLTVLFNGTVVALGAVISPVTVLVAVLSASLLSMARFEMHEMDLQARKPTVPRH